MLVLLHESRYDVFTLLAEYLLNDALGPMNRCSATSIQLFTIINKVIGICDNLQERSYDSRIGKERQEDETKDREELARNSSNVYATLLS
jgi:hypothetical protein